MQENSRKSKMNISLLETPQVVDPTPDYWMQIASMFVL